MIKNRDDLRFYLQEDAKIYGIPPNRIRFLITQHLVDPMHYQLLNWTYIKYLRKSEFYFNNRKKNIFFYIGFIWYINKLRRISLKTGIQAPLNTIGPGFAVWHYGSVVIGADSIGSHFRIGNNTLIGKKNKSGKGPVVGDNVYLCSGAMIIGDVKIGNNVTIAPNSVVTTDVPDNCLVGGTPAKIIKSYD